MKMWAIANVFYSVAMLTHIMKNVDIYGTKNSRGDIIYI